MRDQVRKRILIVDDDALVGRLLREVLEMDSDHQVTTARDAAQALAAARQAPPDLLITDIGLPDVDGVELTEALKEISPETKVIWITAYGRLRTIADCNRLGVLAYLEKPFEIQAIRSAVADALV